MTRANRKLAVCSPTWIFQICRGKRPGDGVFDADFESALICFHVMSSAMVWVYNFFLSFRLLGALYFSVIRRLMKCVRARHD